MPSQLPELTPRQIASGTLLVALVGLGFWLLYRFHAVLIIFFAAIVIATAMRPIVTRLKQRGVPLAPGVIAVYGLLLALATTFLWLLAPVAIEQASTILQGLPDRYGELRQTMVESPNYFVWRLAVELPTDLAPSTAQNVSGSEVSAETALQNLRFLTLSARALFGIVATLILSFYWLLDGQRTIKTLTLLLPMARREGVRQFVDEAEQRVGAFVVGQLTLCLIVGGLALVAFLALGVPNAFLLAVVAGLLEALPLVGPIIGAVPAALFAYSISPAKAIAVVVAMAAIQQLENQLLVPRVMKRAVGINPLVTLLAVSGFSLLFGVPGALVAIPLVAVIQLFFNRTLLAPAVPSQQSLPGRDQASVLHYEVQELMSDLRQQIRHKDSDPSSDNDFAEDTMEAIASDLGGLLAHQNPGGEGP